MTNVSAGASSTLEWLKSLSQIAIPIYQRDYRWSQETCSKLLHDIRQVANGDPDRTHFIGSILAKPDGNGAVTLVDGQQRVTTLVLLMAALRDLARREDARLAETADAVVCTNSGGSRLRPHERHEDVVTQLLSGAPVETASSTFELNYAYFLDQVGDEWRAIWEGLQRLEHVTIELGDRANAQQIFESLNSTGAALSDDELIHNYVHMGRTHADQVQLEREVWSPLEESTAGFTRSFWRDYLVLTSSSQPDFTGDFGIYRTFRAAYPDPIRDITPQLGDEWVRLAQRYRILLRPHLEPDAELAAQLRDIRAFEGAPRPLILGLYDAYCDGRIDQTTLVDNLELIQSMLIRRQLVNLGGDLRNIGTLCRDFRLGGLPLARIIRLTPEDAQVRLALTHSSLPRAGYVLSRLQRPDPTLADLQVEHIYPQNPRTDWSGDGVGRWGDLTTQKQAEFRTLLNTIGNLTLLEAHLNAGASNNSFARKRSYFGRSKVAETQALHEQPAWSAPQIQARTNEMIEIFLETWPRRSDVPMDEPDDLVRVVDLERRPARHADPDIFEYAVFENDVWGDVHNVKDLVKKVASELWKRDPQLLSSTENGRDMVTSHKTKNRRYANLTDGNYLYINWATHYLLGAVQEFITVFGLDDAVRVKLAQPVEVSDEEGIEAPAPLTD